MILDNLTYEQCVVQGVGPMVFPTRLEQGIDPANSARMKAVCVQNIQQQAKIGLVLSRAWEALTRAGIQPVLMKGAALATLYPDPTQRAYGDIDLFVGKKQYHPACAVLRDTFPSALKFDEELDHYKHYNLIADGVSIEIHRVTIAFQHPLDARRYARMEAFGVAHASEVKIGDLRLHIFEPTFNALFVMLHSWEHMMTQGACIRQLCDIALLLHHHAGQMDTKRLRRWLRQLHMTDVWRLYMYLLVHYLDLSEEEAVLFDNGDRLAVRGDRLMTDLLAGRMVEKKSDTPAPANRILRKWHTMQVRLQNARRIAQYSPSYGRHMVTETLWHGALRFFAKDRRWE